MERENKTREELLITYSVDLDEVVEYFKQLKKDNVSATYEKIADALETTRDLMLLEGAPVRELEKLFEGYFCANDMLIAFDEAERDDDWRKVYENAYRGALTHIFGTVELASGTELTPEERRTFHRMIDTCPAALVDDSPFKGATVFIV